MSECLTVKDVAVLLGVTEHFVYKEIRAKRLPAIKLGAKILRITRPDFETYLVAQRC